MSRKRKRSFRSQTPPSMPDPHAASSPPVPHKRVVGMVSVKTIRSTDGNIIIRQGERIREEVFEQYEDEVILEIIANAMPGENHSVNQ